VISTRSGPMSGLRGGDIVGSVSRAVAALIAIASAGGLFAGCFSSGGCGGKCPTAIFDLGALDDSTVTWSIAGAPPQTITSLVPYPPSAGECSFYYRKGEIFASSGVNPDQVIAGSINIQCNSPGGGGFSMSIRDPSDFRNWQVGGFQMPAAKGSVIADIGPNSGLGCNGLYFDGMELNVTVDTATGSPVPFPKVVTDDFARTFRLDFDTSTVTPANSRGEACHVSVSTQVSVHLTQTAADYVVSLAAPCGCE
jgi:hypothetical protein